MSDHKDFLYQGTSEVIKQEIKDAKRLSKEGILDDEPPVASFMRMLGLDFNFNTIDTLFGQQDSSKQPLIHTPNIPSLLTSPKHPELFAGFCIPLQLRVYATNGEFMVEILPPLLKEFNPQAKINVDDLVRLYPQYRKGETFPGGRPNVGTLTDYHLMTPTFLSKEPSLGKVLKMFKYFEIAKASGNPLTFYFPVQEHLLMDLPALKSFFSNTTVVEHEIRTAVAAYKHAAQRIQERYYPDVTLTMLDSSDNAVRHHLENVAQMPEVADAVHSLGDVAYGKKYCGPETGHQMDLHYAATFLSRDGMIIDKDTPPRIIMVHCRDITSFATQALAVYHVLSGKTASWQKSIGIVGGHCIN